MKVKNSQICPFDDREVCLLTESKPAKWLEHWVFEVLKQPVILK